MSEAYNQLINSFNKAIKKKEAKKLSKGDIKEIYQAAHELFDGTTFLSSEQVEQIRDKWVELAGEKLDKASATKKLQGTSRAEAIQSVLLSTLK